MSLDWIERTGSSDPPRQRPAVLTKIRERRLRASHRDLARAGRHTAITEVAYRWSFNDSAHLSRHMAAIPPFMNGCFFGSQCAT
jgi:hypothetical protein